MKNILVTGGFGFIGSHLVDKLLGEGHFVHVVDDLSSNPVDFRTLIKELGTPYNMAVSFCPIADFAKHKRKAGEFDEIYHLASPVGPAGILKHTGKMVWQVVNDTYAVIELAKQTKAKLVDVSTSEVYGGGQGGLCSEEMPRVIQSETTSRLEYAIAKLASETALINTARVNAAFKVMIVRPFNVAGPRQSGQGGFVMPKFVAQALAGHDLTVFGDGTQIRAFTHVKDIVNGLILAMEFGKSGEVYNLGNPENKISIGELAQRVIMLSESPSKVIHMDGRSVYGPLYAEAADKYPNAAKAKLELDWKPAIGIDETILDVMTDVAKRWPHIIRKDKIDFALDKV